MTRLPTMIAIAGMVGLAAAGLILLHDKDLALAVVSGLSGWLTPKPQTPPDSPQSAQPQKASP